MDSETKPVQCDWCGCDCDRVFTCHVCEADGCEECFEVHDKFCDGSDDSYGMGDLHDVVKEE